MGSLLKVKDLHAYVPHGHSKTYLVNIVLLGIAAGAPLHDTSSGRVSEYVSAKSPEKCI